MWLLERTCCRISTRKSFRFVLDASNICVERWLGRGCIIITLYSTCTPDSPLPSIDGIAQPGDGDKTVQAYNYRLCLTQNTSNMLPIPLPTATSTYSKPETWELLRRWVQVRAAAGTPVQLSEVLAIHPTMHGKADINDAGSVAEQSTPLVRARSLALSLSLPLSVSVSVSASACLCLCVSVSLATTAVEDQMR